MIPIRSGRSSLIRACALMVIGIGIIAPTAQAQQKPATPGQFPAGKNMSPLKLPPLPAKKIETKKFGDWTQRCTKRPGATEQNCFLTQTVIQTKNKKKHGLLAIRVGFIGPEQKLGMGLRVPLGAGVLLPPGFKFNVPGIEPTQIVIQSCLPMGCIARINLSPEIIGAMKKAEKGSLEIHTLRKRVMRVPVSFKGFTDALASLDKG